MFLTQLHNYHVYILKVYFTNTQQFAYDGTNQCNPKAKHPTDKKYMHSAIHTPEITVHPEYLLSGAVKLVRENRIFLSYLTFHFPNSTQLRTEPKVTLM